MSSDLSPFSFREEGRRVADPSSFVVPFVLSSGQLPHDRVSWL